jgi:hypothetical protein
MFNSQIYITSWGSYNEGACRGGWVDLDVIDEDNFNKRIKELGLDVNGADEELVIHDYDCEEFSGLLSDMFGEANPIDVVKFYQKWLTLNDQQKLAFFGLYETQGEQYAKEALDEETLNAYTIMDEDAFTQFCEECLSSGFTDGANWQAVERFIDWEAVVKEYSQDHQEFEYEGNNYYMSEN